MKIAVICAMQAPASISFWEKQFVSRADIVILGAGIVGLQSAIKLKQKFPHRLVWVVDRAPFSMGASMRNAGFACFGSPGEILDDSRHTTFEQAIQLYLNRYRGIKLLLQEYGATNLGYERTGGYEIFRDADHEELNHILENVQQINEAIAQEIGEIPFVSKKVSKLGMRVLETAMYTPLEGALQTHLLYRSIRKKALETGVEIYAGLDVQSIEKVHQSWELRTKQGYTFQAKKLVVCTNGFTKELIPDAPVNPARGQILVTSPIPYLPWNQLMHTNKGYIYFRSLGTRILIGGCRDMDFNGENSSEIESNPTIRQALLDFLRETVIPEQEFTITDEWSGIMGMHNDRSPIVSVLDDNLYGAYRMGGMGVALSAKVSTDLAALVEP